GALGSGLDPTSGLRTAPNARIQDGTRSGVLTQLLGPWPEKKALPPGFSLARELSGAACSSATSLSSERVGSVEAHRRVRRRGKNETSGVLARCAHGSCRDSRGRRGHCPLHPSTRELRRRALHRELDGPASALLGSHAAP